MPDPDAGPSHEPGVLVVLSAILTATTLFPRIDVRRLAEILFGALLAGLAVAGAYTRGGRRPGDTRAVGGVTRADWTMPPLELLERPRWSRTRTVRMYALRGYLALAVVMLVVKAIEVGTGH